MIFDHSSDELVKKYCDIHLNENSVDDKINRCTDVLRTESYTSTYDPTTTILINYNQAPDFIRRLYATSSEYVPDTVLLSCKDSREFLFNYFALLNRSCDITGYLLSNGWIVHFAEVKCS